MTAAGEVYNSQPCAGFFLSKKIKEFLDRITGLQDLESFACEALGSIF